MDSKVCPECGGAVPPKGAGARGGGLPKKFCSPRCGMRHSNREVLRRWRKDHPEKYRKRMRRGQLAQYGLTMEQYESMRLTQGNVCAICKQACGVKAHLSVDHCHETGAVRGLLCNHCNQGLGHFKDAPERLRAAADYLDRSVQ